MTCYKSNQIGGDMYLQPNKKIGSIVFCVSIIFFISILFWFTGNCNAEEVKGIKLVESVGSYQTSLGKLNSSFLLQNGNKIGTDASGGMTIEFGFIHIQSDEAAGITDNIDIFQGKTNLSPNITFLQDLESKKWVATDGVMCIDHGSIKLLDNSTVKIIGGKDSPIKICGKEFHDTLVTIKNGKPM